MTVAALIVAAGRGHRVGGNIPKQYMRLDEKTVLFETLSSFINHPKIDHIQVVIHPDDLDLYHGAVTGLDLPPPVHGGATRQASVLCGLEALSPVSPQIVLIHDAARPFCTAGLISDVIAATKTHGAAIPAIPLSDTLKRADNSIITATVDRQNLYRAQTPQGFAYDAILKAHQQATGQALTDDAAVMAAYGRPTHIVPGLETNYKITTTEDLQKAQQQMQPRLTDIRTGMGFDVHAFENGDHVTLCGITIPHSQKLKGHSDADVAMHALTDALLGAIGEGDIGHHFPPSDMQWKNVNSAIFLEKAVQLIKERQGRINHIDLTIICEAPKIGPHREEMRSRLAEIMSLPRDRISVKATTTEKLGFTGRGEGIAAQAVATVCLPAQQDPVT